MTGGMGACYMFEVCIRLNSLQNLIPKNDYKTTDG